jgi:hypothetical protein
VERAVARSAAVVPVDLEVRERVPDQLVETLEVLRALICRHGCIVRSHAASSTIAAISRYARAGHKSRRANAAADTTPTAARYASANGHSSGPAASAPPNGPRSIASRVKPTVSCVSSLSAAW